VNALAGSLALRNRNIVGENRDAAVGLLDRETPEDWLRERTMRVAIREQLADRGTKSIVIFRIGVEWLGLATDVFQEVAEECTIHTLPHRRSGILGGLVSVRGELLLCVNLGALLGVDPAPETTGAGKKTPHLLVCNRKGDRLSFIVNEVFGIHRYNPAELRAAPVTLAKAATGAWTFGMLPWNGRTVGCLDDELVFYALNKGLA
jgi:chemotaxis-related protein WspD